MPIHACAANRLYAASMSVEPSSCCMIGASPSADTSKLQRQCFARDRRRTSSCLRCQRGPSCWRTCSQKPEHAERAQLPESIEPVGGDEARVKVDLAGPRRPHEQPDRHRRSHDVLRGAARLVRAVDLQRSRDEQIWGVSAGLALVEPKHLRTDRAMTEPAPPDPRRPRRTD